jgi:transposase
MTDEELADLGFPLWSGGFCKEPKHPQEDGMAQKRARRRFTREYKAQAVQRVIESGRPLADIAAELAVSPGQLSQWRNEQLAAGSAEALAQKKADEAEMLRLRREVKRLEEENLILRKAAAFFAKGIA